MSCIKQDKLMKWTGTAVHTENSHISHMTSYVELYNLACKINTNFNVS